jgi:hypothetical protein
LKTIGQIAGPGFKHPSSCMIQRINHLYYANAGNRHAGEGLVMKLELAIVNEPFATLFRAVNNLKGFIFPVE